jgi:hypothetical protein
MALPHSRDRSDDTVDTSAYGIRMPRATNVSCRLRTCVDRRLWCGCSRWWWSRDVAAAVAAAGANGRRAMRWSIGCCRSSLPCVRASTVRLSIV